MKTEYFEKFIEALDSSTYIARELGLYFSNKEYNKYYFSKDILNNPFNPIITIEVIATECEKFYDEILSNIAETLNLNFLANYYINRIVESNLHLLFIEEKECKNRMEAMSYLNYGSWSKLMSALKFIDLNNNQKGYKYELIQQYLDLIALAQGGYNDFFLFLHKALLNAKIDIIPICRNNNIHFYKPNYGGYYFKNDITNIELFEESRNFTLPKELDTPKAKELLDKAVEYNLLEDGYKWSSKLLTKKELAYICYVLSNKLGLSSLSNKTDEGRYKTNWKPFKELFNDNNLSNSLRGITTEDTLTETMERIKEIYNF